VEVLIDRLARGGAGIAEELLCVDTQGEGNDGIGHEVRNCCKLGANGGGAVLGEELICVGHERSRC